MGNFRHGHDRKGKRTRTYRVWNNMIIRCKYPYADNYERYGGRGITVCKRWQTFANFLADMGVCPPGKTLDRLDNSRGYSPANCRWATALEQGANQRNNKRIMFGGRTQHLAA